MSLATREFYRSWADPVLAERIAALPPVGKKNIYNSLLRGIHFGKMAGTMEDIRQIVEGEKAVDGIGAGGRAALRPIVVQHFIDQVMAENRIDQVLKGTPAAHPISAAELIRIEDEDRVWNFEKGLAEGLNA